MKKNTGFTALASFVLSVIIIIGCGLALFWLFVQYIEGVQ